MSRSARPGDGGSAGAHLPARLDRVRRAHERQVRERLRGVPGLPAVLDVVPLSRTGGTETLLSLWLKGMAVRMGIALAVMVAIAVVVLVAQNA